MSRQIFVSGTWRDDKAAQFVESATLVGRLLAEEGWSLACGPGTGVARHVVDGFRAVPDRAGVVRYYLPAEVHMTAVGEVVGPGADEILRTNYDYVMRNVHQVSLSAGIIAISGGDGTLEEILPALIDYNLPVAVLKGSGQAAVALERLLDVFPEWAPNVMISTDVDKMVRFVLERAAARRLATPTES